MDTTITMTRGALRGATRSVGVAVDKRTDRPALVNYRLRVIAGRAMLEGTDGFRLHRWTDSVDATGDVDVMLAQSSLDSALKALGAANKANDKLTADLVISESVAALDGHPVTVCTSATYPNTDQLWDRDDGAPDSDEPVIFDPALLTDAANACAKASPIVGDSGRISTLYPSASGQAFRVTRLFGDAGAFGALVMPMFPKNLDLTRTRAIAALSVNPPSVEEEAA